MRRFFALSLAALSTAATANAQATFTVIGGQSTRPFSMSADGTWLAGWDFNGGFRYNAGSTVFDNFSSGFNGVPDVATNGTVAITLLDLGNNEVAGLWTPSGQTLLGGLGGQSGTSISSVYGCSDDAGVVAGLGWINAGQAHAFSWTPLGGMVDLGSTVPNRSSRANGVSGSGNVVVGWDEAASGFRQAAIWPGSASGPVLLNAGNVGEAWNASTDGSVVVGIDNGNLFRWTQAGGLVSLGKLPDAVAADDATGVSVSADGNTIVGFCGDSFFGTPFRAFIWRPGAGVVELKSLLVALGAAQAGNFGLSQASEVSDDGKTIAGIAGALPFGPFDGWIATLPDVAKTYCTAQINSDGCAPAIGFAGTPSASFGSGFHVTASQLVAGQNGILFYSTTGPANTPFLGGVLCAQQPLTRLPIQNSGGAGACGGAFDFDFNAWVPLSADPALVGGATVWAQCWSRDPASASTTNLTDALEFVLWP